MFSFTKGILSINLVAWVTLIKVNDWKFISNLQHTKDIKTVLSEENYVPQPHQLVQEMRQSVDKAHFYSLYSLVTLKIVSRSPKSNQFF